MKIERLDYAGYRNLQPGRFVPQDGVNVIFGKNAQGKTNLLEAMWLFTGGRSFRGARDADLIARGGQRAELGLSFFSAGREQSARVVIRDGKRAVELNGIPKKSPFELVGSFRAVIFSPEHLSLVRDGPAFRRNFIDSALCQLRPAYAKVLAHYRHTLNQRNALLKDIPRHAELLETLPVWDEKLVRYGNEVTRGRTEYARRLLSPVREIYAGISENRETIGLSYRSGAQDLARALGESRKEDLSCGHTTAGPHRDDLEITVDGQPARTFGSQGQKRSAVLACKLAEARILKEETGEEPAVFLDDVMSELDSGRQDYLLNHLCGFQVFLTCCEPETVKRLKAGVLFEMDGGRLQKK